MSYRDSLNYLGSKTRIIELCNQIGGRVVVCPDWNGRVMTSTCNGIDGNSFGFINVREIDAQHVKEYGGESHLVLPLDDGPFEVDSMPQTPSVRMRHSARKTFEADIVRIVRLLDNHNIRLAFGSDVAVSLEQTDISYVGFVTVNSIINPHHGEPFSLLNENVSMRLCGMFNSGQSSIAIIPFQSDGESHLETSVVNTDFFGSSPHGRLRILPQAALLRADGKYRCRIAIPGKRAVSSFGAIDFRDGLLTLIKFDLSDFEDDSYEPVWAYNHGPTEPGETDFARYYEFNVSFPIHERHHNEVLTRHQYTLHINADNRTLAYLIQKFLGVDYEKVYEKMMK